jgi:hypothetical protein
VVWLFAGGMEITQIAAIADKSRQIIYQWIHSYPSTHQTATLKDAHRTGIIMKIVSNERITWFFDLNTATAAKLPFVNSSAKQLICSFEEM